MFRRALLIAATRFGLACSTTPSISPSTSATGGGGAGGGTNDGGAGGEACKPASKPLGTDPSGGESFPDLELRSCDGSTVGLGDLRCQSAVTLLSIGAGWCEPCKAEASLLQDAAVKLADEDVSIVQVLFQDAASLPATTLFCQAWVDTYELSIPVLIDPVGTSEK